MADQGGIYPNRHRFINKAPVLGLASVTADPNPWLPADGAPAGASPAAAAASDGSPPDSDGSGSGQQWMTVVDLRDAKQGGSASLETFKEVGRRAQACRPWVCYGNPRCKSVLL